MDTELHEHTPEPNVENQVIEPKVVPPTLKKSKKKIWIIVGGIIVVLSILCVALVVYGFGKVMVEKAPIEVTLDKLMKNLVAKDIDSAYALFSLRAQRQFPISDLEEMIRDNNYKVFEGYENISIQNLNLTAAANTNPDIPQGTVANVKATVSYTGGFTGDLQAVLEKVEGEWRLFYFHVNVPIDKLQP